MNGPYPEITNISFLAKLFFKTFISLKHLSDYRTVGLSDRRIIATAPFPIPWYIFFSRKGTFYKKNKTKLVQQERKAMFYVLRKARKLCLPIDVLLQLVDAMVAPILLYGSEVWGYED